VTSIRALDDGEIEGFLKPWILRRYKKADPAWQEIVAKEISRMDWKARLRWLRSAKSFLTGTYRTVGFVKEQYNKTWSAVPYPDRENKGSYEKLEFFDWKDNGFVLRYGDVRSMHLEMLARAIDAVAPRRILEVGAGMGTNIHVLSSLFPDIQFTGVELTESGVARAKACQAEGVLPKEYRMLSPRAVKNETAFMSSSFIQGNAVRLPFADKSFDLVFTCLALEQMKSIQSLAIAEISRVSAGNYAMVEPLNDSNADPLRKTSKIAKQHLDLALADLPRHGFEKIFHYSAWPQKLTRGADFVLARKSAQ